MKSILEELWEGEIQPREDAARKDMGLRLKVYQMGKAREQLTGALTGEQKALLEEVERRQASLEREAEKQIFVYAFRLGWRFARELEGEEPEIEDD